MESLHKHWPTSQGQSPTGLFPASFRKADNDAEFATDQELYLILRGSFVMTRLSCRGEPVYWYYGKANDLLTTGAMGGWAEIPDTNHDLEISQPMETIEMSVESQGKIAPRPLLLGRQHEANLQRELLPGSGDDGQEPLQSGTLEAVVALGGESHLLTIAPIAAARVRSCVIPNLLTFSGSAVVVDLTGEAYAVTSRARREMGQAIVRLDPFRVIDEDSDALDPFDLLQGLEGPALESACQDVAGLLPGFHTFNDVWDNAAFGLLAGVIGYLSAVPEKNRFAELYSTFHNDDVVYSLAVVLDMIGKRIPKMAYTEISAFLQKSDAERSRIITSVTSQLKALGSQEAQKVLSTSTVPLTDVVEGKPVSIYLMLPPAKVVSHYSLLRVWIGTVLQCVMDRRSRVVEPTLFVLDECARLGSFPQLETAITSGGKSGFRIWTLWQDLHQLQVTYPSSWLLNNCGAVQIFGSRDYSAAAELAAFLGVEASDVRSLAADEQLVCREGVSQKIKQFDYVADPLFAGRFDRSPLNSRTTTT
jgi:type IV secretion system protein VirD4